MVTNRHCASFIYNYFPFLASNSPGGSKCKFRSPPNPFSSSTPSNFHAVLYTPPANLNIPVQRCHRWSLKTKPQFQNSHILAG